jgi:hypothetical protein
LFNKKAAGQKPSGELFTSTNRKLRLPHNIAQEILPVNWHPLLARNILQGIER